MFNTITKHTPAAEIKAKDASNRLPTYVALLMSDITHMSNVVNKQQIAESIEMEISDKQRYLNCPIGRMQINSDLGMDFEILHNLVESAMPLLNLLGTKSDLDLLKVATATVTLRRTLVQSAQGSDWSSVRNVLVAERDVFSHPLVRDEACRLAIEADNYDICRIFEHVLEKDRHLNVVKLAIMANNSDTVLDDEIIQRMITKHNQQQNQYQRPVQFQMSSNPLSSPIKQTLTPVRVPSTPPTATFSPTIQPISPISPQPGDGKSLSSFKLGLFEHGYVYYLYNDVYANVYNIVYICL